MRIGITTGEALVTLGTGEDTEGVVGDVVNTASRLQGVAPVGGVVVGEATFRATSQLFDYQELTPVKVKGKANPVPVWRLVAARSRTGIEAVRRPDTPFVGRGAELDRLRRLFERTVTGRAVRLVTIVGEPGVGKSRFVGEPAAFVDARRELVVWRQGRCLPHGDGITFWALGEIVKAQAGILESDGPAQVAGRLKAAVEALLPVPSEAEWLVARLAPLVGIADPEAAKPERAELFAAWRRFVEAIAATRRADGQTGGRAGRPVGPARRGAGAAAGAGGRQPAGRGGVRAAARRPWAAGRRPPGGGTRDPRPRDGARPDRRPDTAEVQVVDGCGGIPEPDLPRVFERLWRGDPARTTNGAGLGLAIARGLVEAHGGTVAVANLDGGCRFTVRLPTRTGTGTLRAGGTAGPAT